MNREFTIIIPDDSVMMGITLLRETVDGGMSTRYLTCEPALVEDADGFDILTLKRLERKNGKLIPIEE